MMTARKPTYEELEDRLLETEDLIGALRNHQVDVIVGEERIAVVRLREVEEALEKARAEIEQRVVERTAELARVNRQLRETIDHQKGIQVQLERSARQRREHAELLDLAHDMIFVHDMEGRIIKEGWWEGELVRTTRDGRQVTVAARWALRRNADGRPATILEIDNDMTARKHAEQEMAEARRFAESIVDTMQESLVVLDAQLRIIEELMMSEERQRRQIAQALHDSVAQSLAFSKRELNLLRQRGPEEVRGRLQEVCLQLDEAIKHTRDLTLALSPSTLFTRGLQAALEELADQFAESEGFHCRVEGPRDCLPLNEPLRTLLYRAVRELLVNVAKHAEAKNVRIVLDHTEQGLRIAVQDDGKGFDVSLLKERGKDGGFGMLSVRERLVRVGGALAVESAQGKGTKVTMNVPVDRGQRSDGGGVDSISI